MQKGQHILFHMDIAQYLLHLYHDSWTSLFVDWVFKIWFLGNIILAINQSNGVCFFLNHISYFDEYFICWIILTMKPLEIIILNTLLKTKELNECFNVIIQNNLERKINKGYWLKLFAFQDLITNLNKCTSTWHIFSRERQCYVRVCWLEFIFSSSTGTISKP